MGEEFLRPVFFDRRDEIITDDRFYASGRTHLSFIPLKIEDTIPIPKDTILFRLPDRNPVVFDENLDPVLLTDRTPIAAFIPPGYTQTLLASFRKVRDTSVLLPLFSYSAIGMYKGRLRVAAIQVDRDKRHRISGFREEVILKRGERLLRLFPKNRLIEHLVLNCAYRYKCPNARNLIMNRSEAPLPVSNRCNSRCLGCISFQKKSSGIVSPQERLGFSPTEDELFETAEYHIKNVKRPILSFGQGCEGEPLLSFNTIFNVIERIRRRYRKVTININTNGSRPSDLRSLFEAGLDSARISLNSFDESIYNAYYKPIDYSYSDVIKSIQIGNKMHKWISINYLVFPGLIDSVEELRSLSKVFYRTKPNMLQLRNLNIDPDLYIEKICPQKPKKIIGIKEWMNNISKKFPSLRFGYFNPYIGDR